MSRLNRAVGSSRNRTRARERKGSRFGGRTTILGLAGRPTTAASKITGAQYEVVRDTLVKSGALRRGITDKEICSLITDVHIARRARGTCQPPNFHKYLTELEKQPAAFRGELHAAPAASNDFGAGDDLWDEPVESLAAVTSKGCRAVFTAFR